MEPEASRVDVCVRDQYLYKDIWYAVVGEVLVCKKKPNNFQDRYAVAVKKENFARLIFAHKGTRENILTAKITQTTVAQLHSFCTDLLYEPAVPVMYLHCMAQHPTTSTQAL